MQLEDSSNEEITKQMELLNQQYDAFTAKWGLINSTGNQRAFSQDASYYLLSSLEILDEEGNLKEKAEEEQLVSALKKYIQQENTGIVYVDMTRLGLVELTRKKNGKTLRELFADGRKEEE